MSGKQEARRFRTALGTVTTRECLATELGKGDRFVGPDGYGGFVGAAGPIVFQVLTPASRHKRGWLVTRNVSMTAAEVARLRATPGAVEAGSDPRDGFFTNSQIAGLRVHRIV